MSKKCDYRPLHERPVKVRLCLAPDMMVFAKVMAHTENYLDAADYLTAVLNRALFEEMDEAGVLDQLRSQEHRDPYGDGIPF